VLLSGMVHVILTHQFTVQISERLNENAFWDVPAEVVSRTAACLEEDAPRPACLDAAQRSHRSLNRVLLELAAVNPELRAYIVHGDGSVEDPTDQLPGRRYIDPGPVWRALPAEPPEPPLRCDDP